MNSSGNGSAFTSLRLLSTLRGACMPKDAFEMYVAWSPGYYELGSSSTARRGASGRSWARLPSVTMCR